MDCATCGEIIFAPNGNDFCMKHQKTIPLKGKIIRVSETRKRMEWSFKPLPECESEDKG